MLKRINESSLFLWVGRGVFLVSLYFIFQVFSSVDVDWIGFSVLLGSASYLDWFFVFSLYSLVLFFGSVVWCWFVVMVDGGKFAPGIFPVFFVTNVQKYFPGNFIQFLGRSYYGARLGYSQRAVWFANLIEVSSVSVSVGFVVVLGVSYFWSYINFGSVVFWFGFLFLLLSFGFLWGAGKIDFVGAFLGFLLSWQFVFSVLIYSFVFFLLGAIVYYLGCRFFGYPYGLPLFFLVSVSFAVSWLFGFLLPGVPGGVGVRESAFVFLVSTAPVYIKGQFDFLMSPSAQQEWLFLMLVARLLGLVVEFLFAAFSWPILARQKLV